MRVYVGAPIDTTRPEHSPQEQFQQIAERVVEGLSGECVIFNPFAAFYHAGRSKEAFDLTFVTIINKAALDQSQLGVFVWNGSPSYGMPLEIDFCVQWDKKVVVLNTTGKPLGLYLRALEAQGKIAIVDSSLALVLWLKSLLVVSGSEDDGETE